jgi:tetratricopeptide (TPR) repeat protein/serine/threonine protein kinase
VSVDFPKLQQIFLSTIEQHRPESWEAYLNEACAGDNELRNQVKLLLKAHVEAGSVPGAAANGQDQTHFYQNPAEVAGATIGPYKLLEHIGEGGMGSVWMAEQTEPIQRRVALKVVKEGMDSKEVLARFEAERQALALMEHPNIAKVLDAGKTPAGRPYFVMELVKGQPITKYCDEKRLAVRERLELFGDVCRAVQHAHQKGIIHRDLKPTNVLVAPYDGKPVVKVIDFGVAKATGQRLTDKTLFTGIGAVVGTLEYMSPEQAEVNNQDIDTRSDIYSLGVLLYELLAGSPPFTRKQLEKAGMLEMLRVIREQEPSKPSTKLSTAEGLPTLAANRGTEPAKLTKLLRGELDWIVMKSLEKDRNRRYETANGLATDVQRYLADEPVVACPPSAGYRLRKFLRRNKPAVAVASVIATAALIVVGSVGWMVRDRAAERTERTARIASQVDLILQDVDRLEKEQKWPDALAAARRAKAAMSSGEADLATAERVHQRLRDLEFIDRLEHARMVLSAWVEGSFDYAGANREYSRAFREYGVDVEELAVEMSIDSFKAHPALALPVGAALDDWVAARRDVAKQDVADWQRLVAVARGIDPDPLRNRLRATWGQPLTPQLQDELRRLAEAIDIRAQSPASLVILARTLLRAKHSDSALRVLRDAQAAYPGDFWLNLVLAAKLSDQHDREESIRYSTASVAIRPNSTVALNNLGVALREQKKLDEAITYFRKAIDFDPKQAMAHSNLGRTLRDQGKRDEAIAAFRKGIELDPKDARAHNSLGMALREKGKEDEAVAEYRKAIELDPKLAVAHQNLGRALRDTRLDNAIAEYRKAIELDPNLAPAHFDLAVALRLHKQLAEAIAEYRKAVELDPKWADARFELSSILLAQGDVDEAIGELRRVIELEPKSTSASFAHMYLGTTRQHQGKLDEAIAEFRQAIELNPKYGRIYDHLGDALKAKRDLEGAERAYRDALNIKKQLAAEFPSSQKYRQDLQPAARQELQRVYHHDLAKSLCQHADLLRDMRRFPEAQPEYEQALNIQRQLVAEVPDRPNLRNDLARTCRIMSTYYRHQGDWAGAKQILLEAQPHHLAALNADVQNAIHRTYYRDYLRELIKVHAGLLEQDDSIRAAETCRDLRWDAGLDAYNAACYVSLCIPVVSKHNELDDKQRKDAALFYGDAAMKLLSDAVSKGFKDVAQMKRDSDLDPVRQRKDFRTLVAELEGRDKKESP